jgi:signal peptidase I
MTARKPPEDLQKAHRKRKSRESFLETLESIIVAFVLAFIFRAFIVEPFVIPTGSMGPTLYGAHVEFKCSDCGYEFAVGTDGKLQASPICPNCFLVQEVPPGGVPQYSGDRILVLKFLYDFKPPERWNVIVFRNPNQPEQNYIKRLVALPGETVELVRGDVTINGQIVQKPDEAQDALWMLVHDTRYRPTRRDWQPRWVGDKEWEVRQAGFAAERPPRDKPAWLAYQHRDADGHVSNIMDFYAYNCGKQIGQYGSEGCTDLGLRTEVTAGQASSVVIIEMRAYKDRFRFELTAEGSDRPTRVLLNDKPVAQAVAGVLPVGRAVCVQAANVDHKLMLVVDGKRVTPILSLKATAEGDVIYEPTPLTPKEIRLYDQRPLKPEEYQLLNLEPLSREQDRYTLTEDERRVFDSKPMTPDERRLLDYRKKNDPRALSAEVRIGARGGPVALGYLRLERDVYYLNHQGGSPQGQGIEGHPFLLESGEYFVLGDNSPQSFDCRWWPLRRPVVPQRNLVGKAFFVYWPSAGMRHGIPLAPDVTGFRLVH